MDATFAKIQSWARGKEEYSLFFCKVDGEDALLHEAFYRPACLFTENDSPEEWFIGPVLFSGARPDGAGLDVWVRAIWRRGHDGRLMAKAWCLKTEFDFLDRELVKTRSRARAMAKATEEETIRKLRVVEAEVAAEESARNVLLLKRRRAENEVETWNPSTYQSAVTHGWRDTSTGNPDSARRVKMVKMVDGVERTITMNRPARSRSEGPAYRRAETGMRFPRLARVG